MLYGNGNKHEGLWKNDLKNGEGKISSRIFRSSKLQERR